jgi:aminoglycoside phosphotransferase (APT) family kinase protein
MGGRREPGAEGTRSALDQHLQRIGLALYGTLPQIHSLHSENSYVCCLDFGPDLPDKVIKYACANAKQVLREQAVLRALSDAGLSVPAVEFTQDDCPIETSPFLIMPRLAETSLHEACLSRAGWAGPALGKAGRFVARLSALPPDLLAGGRGVQGTAGAHVAPAPIAYRARPIDEWALASDLSGDETCLVGSHLRRIDRMLDETSSLVHGSYSPAHILCDVAGSFAVIDWENAGGGSVLRDVGHFLAALEVWAGRDPEHARCFLDGFQVGQPLSRADRRAIGDWALYTLLVWANFFAGQGRRGASEQVLQVARSHLAGDCALHDD